MSAFAFNLVLAIAWTLLAGEVSLATLVTGFVVGLLAIAACAPMSPAARAYLHRLVGGARLTAVFGWALVVANLLLARDLLRRRPPFTPGFIRLPLGDGLSPAATVLLGELVSLTPGTLTVDAREDGREIVVHTLYAQDPEAVRRDVERFARLVRIALGAPETRP